MTKQILATLIKTVIVIGIILLYSFLRNVKLFVVNVFSKSVEKWFTCTYLSMEIKHFVDAKIMSLSVGVLIFFTCKV